MVQRRDLVARQARRLAEDLVERARVEMPVGVERAQPADPRHLLEGEAHLGDGRGIGHHTIFPGLSRFLGSSVALRARIIWSATGDL